MPEQSPSAAAPGASNTGMPAPAQTQNPPMGVSPATGPTPNKGYEAAAMQRVGVVLTQLTDLLPMAGATTDLGKAVLKAIETLAKVVPPGSVSPQQQKNTIDQMQMKNAQNQGMMKQMQAGGQPGAAGQGAAKPPDAGMAA